VLKEFRDFAMKGNVVDLAVAVIIGAAFGAIVSSAVEDVIMPPIGLAVGGMDFSELTLVIGEKPGPEPGSPPLPVTINYGIFINKLVNFLIIAFVLFLVVRSMAKLMRKKPAAPAAPPVPAAEVVLLTEIRDLLKQNR
jgi:large conductance mechanosensitive channel